MAALSEQAMRRASTLALMVAILTVGTVEPLPMSHVREHFGAGSLTDIGETKEFHDHIKSQFKKTEEAKSPADAWDAVSEKVALAKQASLNNEQRLKQITAEAESERRSANRVKADVDEAEKIAQQKLKVEKTNVSMKASDDLMRSIQAKKREENHHAEKLAALKETIMRHQATLKTLDLNLKKMNDAKSRAQKSALEEELHKLELEKGVLVAQYTSKASTLIVLKKTHKMAEAQIQKNEKGAKEEEETAKKLAGELGVLKATAKGQEGHLQKAVDKAKLNTKVQEEAMDQIRHKFQKETSTLQDKIYAMKQSVALKKAHISSLQKEEMSQHAEEAKKTTELNKLTYTVKKQTMANEYSTKQYKNENKKADSELLKLHEQVAKVKAERDIAQSKVDLEHKKVEAVRTVQHESQKQSVLATDDADAAVEKAKLEIKALSEEKAATNVAIRNAEIEVLKLVKKVAHTKILAAPEHKKAHAVRELLNETLAGKVAAVADAKKWSSQVKRIRPRLTGLLAQEQSREMRLPQASGELDAVKRSVDQKQEEKRDAKVEAQEEEERHKQAASRFAKVAQEAVRMQKKENAATEAMNQAEDDISEAKAAVQTQRTDATGKIDELQRNIQNQAQVTAKNEANSHVLGSAYATLMGEIASVKQTLAQHTLMFSQRQRDMNSESEVQKRQVTTMAVDFDRAKLHLLHSKHALELFLNQSSADARRIVDKNMAEERKLASQALSAKQESKEAVDGVNAVKLRVSAHMQRTIARERKMQQLRQRGISKMSNYAQSVLQRLRAVLSSDHAQNAELRDEISQLEAEVKSMRKRDEKEEEEEAAHEAEVDAIKQKEIEVQQDTRDEISRQVEQVVKIEGGKTDAETSLINTELVKQKLQVAHLAQEIKAANNRTDRAEASTARSLRSTQKLQEERSEVKNGIQEYSDAIENEHSVLKDESGKNKELGDELRALKARGARKKRKLALIVNKHGADTEKVKEMANEINENTLKIKELQAKLGIEDDNEAQRDTELATLTLAVDNMSNKVTEDKEKELEDRENAKLLGLQLQDTHTSLSQAKDKSSALEIHIRALEQELEAKRQQDGTSEAHERDEMQTVANMTVDERQAREQLIAEKMAEKQKVDELTDAQDQLHSLQLEEDSAEKDSADNKAEYKALKGALMSLKKEARDKMLNLNREISLEQRQEQEAGVSTMDASTLKAEVQAENGRVEAEKEKLGHEKSVLREEANQVSENKQEIQDAKADVAAERGAIGTQEGEVTKLMTSTEDQTANINGEVDALKTERDRLKGQAIKNTIFLTQDKALAATEKRDSVTAEQTFNSLKDKLTEVNENISSDIEKKASEESSIAKYDAVSAALRQTVLKEKILSNETTTELNQLKQSRIQAETKKEELDGKKTVGDEALTAAQTKEERKNSKLEDAEAALATMRADVVNNMGAIEGEIKEETQSTHTEAAHLQDAKVKEEQATINVAEMQAELDGQQGLLKSLIENLGDLNSQRTAMENKLQDEEQSTAAAQARVESTKVKSGGFSRQAEAKKQELQQLQQSQNQVKAEAGAHLAEVKAKIADAEETKAKSQSEIDELKNRVQVLTMDDKDVESSSSKMSAEVFSKEKDLEVLKRKVEVLKAFLSGPLLSVDNADESNVEASTEEAPTEEPQLMEDAALKPLPPLKELSAL